MNGDQYNLWRAILTNQTVRFPTVAGLSVLRPGDSVTEIQRKIVRNQVLIIAADGEGL